MADVRSNTDAQAEGLCHLLKSISERYSQKALLTPQRLRNLHWYSYAPNVDPTSTLFGTTTAAFGSRNIQFGLKFIY